jgi:cell division protein FtsL
MDKEKKTKLFLTMIITIIALLIVGIVYQFVCIKQMQREIESLKTTTQITAEYKENLNQFFVKI